MHTLEAREQPAERFWKDEGGRANMLRFTVAAPASLKENVQLQAVLCYEDGSPVEPADAPAFFHLVTSPAALVVGPGALEATIEFRIEKVSRKVGDRDFRLQVLPKYADGLVPPNGGLGGILSNPINVMSKRQKGVRDTAASLRAASSSAPHSVGDNERDSGDDNDSTPADGSAASRNSGQGSSSSSAPSLRPSHSESARQQARQVAQKLAGMQAELQQVKGLMEASDSVLQQLLGRLGEESVGSLRAEPGADAVGQASSSSGYRQSSSNRLPAPASGLLPHALSSSSSSASSSSSSSSSSGAMASAASAYSSRDGLRNFPASSSSALQTSRAPALPAALLPGAGSGASDSESPGNGSSASLGMIGGSESSAFAALRLAAAPGSLLSAAALRAMPTASTPPGPGYDGLLSTDHPLFRLSNSSDASASDNSTLATAGAGASTQAVASFGGAGSAAASPAAVFPFPFPLRQASSSDGGLSTAAGVSGSSGLSPESSAMGMSLAVRDGPSEPRSVSPWMLPSSAPGVSLTTAGGAIATPAAAARSGNSSGQAAANARPVNVVEAAAAFPASGAPPAFSSSALLDCIAPVAISETETVHPPAAKRARLVQASDEPA